MIVSLQQLLDAGFNIFAFQLLAKEFSKMHGSLQDTDISTEFKTRDGSVWLTLSSRPPEEVVAATIDTALKAVAVPPLPAEAGIKRGTEAQKWIRVDAGVDAIELQPSLAFVGVNVRVPTKDGEVSLRSAEVRQVLLKMAAALEVSSLAHQAQAKAAEKP